MQTTPRTQSPAVPVGIGSLTDEPSKSAKSEKEISTPAPAPTASNRSRGMYFPAYFGHKTFTRTVEGDGMEAASRTSFSPGDVIFIDPDVTPQEGNCVLACWYGEREFFLRLVTVDGKRYLEALNPTIEIRMRPLTEEWEILGVCIAKFSKEN